MTLEFQGRTSSSFLQFPSSISSYNLITILKAFLLGLIAKPSLNHSSFSQLRRVSVHVDLSGRWSALL